MVLIVGLGNPGAKYARTRHNVGFDVVEILAARNQIELNRTRCKAKVGEGRIGNVRVALAQPQTYMNLSGEAVTQLVNWYKVAPEELLVVYDDVDLPFGRVRIRPRAARERTMACAISCISWDATISPACAWVSVGRRSIGI